MSTIDNESPKEQMIAILRDQPDDSTFDELLRELACRRAIRRGLKDVDERKTVTNEEALQQIKSWQKNSMDGRGTCMAEGNRRLFE